MIANCRRRLIQTVVPSPMNAQGQTLRTPFVEGYTTVYPDASPMRKESQEDAAPLVAWALKAVVRQGVNLFTRRPRMSIFSRA